MSDLLPRMYIGIEHDSYGVPSRYIVDEHTMGLPDQAEYIRADLVDALKAQVSELREALQQIGGLIYSPASVYKIVQAALPNTETPFSECQHDRMKPNPTLRPGYPENGQMVWFCNKCQSPVRYPITVADALPNTEIDLDASGPDHQTPVG